MYIKLFHLCFFFILLMDELSFWKLYDMSTPSKSPVTSAGLLPFHSLFHDTHSVCWILVILSKAEHYSKTWCAVFVPVLLCLQISSRYTARFCSGLHYTDNGQWVSLQSLWADYWPMAWSNSYQLFWYR